MPANYSPRRAASNYRYWLYSLLLAMLSLQSVAAFAQSRVWLLDVQGAIGPATADYINRGMVAATADAAHLVVVRMDTPGGLDKSMRVIIKQILAAPIPVVTYVAPAGARAASAGTFILYASHIAAMAPATNLGAATPVQLAPLSTPGSRPGNLPDQMPGQPDQRSGASSPGKTNAGQRAGSAMENKVLNDAVAYIEGLADLRNRNRDFAVSAVRDGASLTASEALKNNVIDIVAESLDDLLDQLHQRSVALVGGEQVLDTASTTITRYAPDWRNRFLSVITDPNVAYILMLVGIYGLFFEFSNPGMVGPGFVGVICLLLAFYAFQVLPVSYTGALLILLGVALLIAEALMPSFGILGLSGVAAFIIGSIVLMDTELPAYQIAKPLVFGFAAISAGLLVVVLRMVLQSSKRAVVTGLGALTGNTATVEDVDDQQVWVRLNGERWRANCAQALAPGDTVVVEGVSGLLLSVSKQERQS